MTSELQALLFLCLFAPAQAIVSATLIGNIAGFAWGLGNRHSEPVLPDWAVRLKRSHANLMENLPSFVGLVLIAHVLHGHDATIAEAAWTFVVARVVFAVLYTAGVTFLYARTMIFFVSIGALVTMAWRMIAFHA